MGFFDLRRVCVVVFYGMLGVLVEWKNSFKVVEDKLCDC